MERSDIERPVAVPLIPNELNYDTSLLSLNGTPGPWARIIRRVKARIKDDLENIAKMIDDIENVNVRFSETEIRQLVSDRSKGVDSFYSKIYKGGLTLRNLDDLLRITNNEEARKVYTKHLPITICPNTRTPSDLQVIQGDELKLVVEVRSGFPRPEAVWYKGTERLPRPEVDESLEEDGLWYSYVKRKITPKDAGSYHCKFINGPNEAEDNSDFTVRVGVNPIKSARIERKCEANPLRYIRSANDGPNSPPPSALQLDCVTEPVDEQPVKYEWFKDEQSLSETRKVLYRRVVTSIMGDYHCQVTWENGDVSKTQIESVVVVIGAPLEIIQQPLSRPAYVGDLVKLEFKLNKYDESIECQWFFKQKPINDDFIQKQGWNREDISGEMEMCLVIRNVSRIHGGSYACHVKGPKEDACLTSPATLEVKEQPRSFTATRKVALLIGNSTYVTQPKLNAPFNDLITLGRELEAVGFQVVSFFNIRKDSMWKSINMFIDSICEGSYAFFFFTGHGFQALKDTFLMPLECEAVAAATIDSEEEPQRRLRECLCECFRVQALVDAIEAKSPALTAVVIDSCRSNLEFQVPPIPEFNATAHKATTAILHITSPGLLAYERKDATNGFLVRYLTEGGLLRSHLSLEELFRKVRKGVRDDNDELLKYDRKQVPEATYTLNLERSLADMVDQGGPLAKDESLPCHFMNQAEVFNSNYHCASLQDHHRLPVAVERPITNTVVVTIGKNKHIIGSLETRHAAQSYGPFNVEGGDRINLIVTVNPQLGTYFFDYPINGEEKSKLKQDMLPFAFTPMESPDLSIPAFGRLLPSTDSETPSHSRENPRGAQTSSQAEEDEVREDCNSYSVDSHRDTVFLSSDAENSFASEPVNESVEDHYRGRPTTRRFLENAASTSTNDSGSKWQGQRPSRPVGPGAHSRIPGNPCEHVDEDSVGRNDRGPPVVPPPAGRHGAHRFDGLRETR